MSILNIKQSQLKVKESAALKAELEEELAAAKQKNAEAERRISDLLNENTLLKKKVAASETKKIKGKKNDEDTQGVQ